MKLRELPVAAAAVSAPVRVTSTSPYSWYMQPTNTPAAAAAAPRPATAAQCSSSCLVCAVCGESGRVLALEGSACVRDVVGWSAAAMQLRMRASCQGEWKKVSKDLHKRGSLFCY